MIRSMTGFGEASTQHQGTHYFLELRSLNNRFFKATIRLPEEFQGLEAEIEAALRTRLTRGSLTVSGSASDATASAAYRINSQALDSYIKQLQATPQVAGGTVKIEIGPLLALPGVLQPPADEEARIDRAREAFMGLLDRACVELEQMRVREGRVLRDELLALRETIAQSLKTVAARAPFVVAEYEARLKQRMEQLLRDSGIAAQPIDIIREIASYAERTDIREEITRLTGHLDQFAALITRDDPKPIGRTLDFMAQEMLREANTMASKSNDVDISRAVVEIKSAIDRIKEQAANIE
jgi:uncharacterized protein (TIGR00255 family)